MTGAAAHAPLPELSLPALQQIRAALAGRIREGLATDGAQIRALPAFLAPPARTLSGRALAIDTGGTNMRAAIVELSPAGDRVVAGPVQGPVPTGRDGADVDATAFFGAHAALVSQLGEAASGLPIGYCFSYPSESLPDHDARLLRWTKGVSVSGVEGTAVGAALRVALAARGLSPGPVAVLNDTVAALMAGARTGSAGTDPGRTLGLIVGTGTNIAAFFDTSAITKLTAAGPLRASAPGGVMAVNLESGNFDPPHRAPCDDVVDRASDNPGAQRFEKAVSGHYLPQVARAVAGGAVAGGTAPVDGAALVAQANAGDPVCRAVLERSAALVAAALAGVADVAAPGQTMRVLAEGGLFWSDSGYRARVEETLARLERPLIIDRAPDANLVGSAAAALAALS